MNFHLDERKKQRIFPDDANQLLGHKVTVRTVTIRAKLIEIDVGTGRATITSTDLVEQETISMPIEDILEFSSPDNDPKQGS